MEQKFECLRHEVTVRQHQRKFHALNLAHFTQIWKNFYIIIFIVILLYYALYY